MPSIGLIQDNYEVNQNKHGAQISVTNVYFTENIVDINHNICL